MNISLPENPTWTIVIIALATPVLTFIGAWMKLKNDGLSAANIEEIKDRARFRQHMLNRVEILENRERELLVQLQALTVKHENREKDLLNQIAELHVKTERLEEALREALSTGKSERDRIEGKADKAQHDIDEDRERRK